MWNLKRGKKSFKALKCYGKETTKQGGANKSNISCVSFSCIIQYFNRYIYIYIYYFEKEESQICTLSTVRWVPVHATIIDITLNYTAYYIVILI